MRCLGRAPLRFTPGLPGKGHTCFLPPQEPRDVRMTWSTNHRARAGGEQAGGKEEGNPLGRPGVKRLPPRPLTTTTNQASLPGALSTVTFPFKKKKILIWSFFCFQSGQGEEERCQQGPPPPRPQSVQGPHGNATQLVLSRGANSDLCRVQQRPPSSHDPEKKLVGKPGHTSLQSHERLASRWGQNRYTRERCDLQGEELPVTSSGVGPLPCALLPNFS